MTNQKRGIPMRVDPEFDNFVKEFAKKNEISIRQATREITRMSKGKASENKILKEIKF